MGDLGQMIVADEGHSINKSAVVKCNWKETEKNFDWAPMEVKKKKGSVNFAFPIHAFDIFSLGVLASQLHTESVRLSRTSVLAFANGDENAVGEAIGFSEQLLKKMLGSAEGRPHPIEVYASICPVQCSRISQHISQVSCRI